LARYVLDGARELQHTDYKDISIGPDQTRKQRQAEKRLVEVAEKKNREELTQEDMSKNLKWMAVGRKGEKRIAKVQVREESWGEGPSGSQVRGRGRGRGRPRGRGRGDRNPEGREGVGMELEAEEELGSQKRVREDLSESGEEEEEGECSEPPRHRTRQ